MHHSLKTYQECWKRRHLTVLKKWDKNDWFAPKINGVRDPSSIRVLWKSFQYFLCNPADKQMDSVENVISLVETDTHQHCLPPEIMTWLLKIIHRPRCEQVHVGTTGLYPPNLSVHSKKHASTHWLEACSLGWLRQSTLQHNLTPLMFTLWQPRVLLRCMLPSAQWQGCFV